MSKETKQQLFTYLSKELNVIALDSNLSDIEKIVISDDEHYWNKAYSKLGELTFGIVKKIYSR